MSLPFSPLGQKEAGRIWRFYHTLERYSLHETIKTGISETWYNDEGEWDAHGENVFGIKTVQCLPKQLYHHFVPKTSTWKISRRCEIYIFSKR